MFLRLNLRDWHIIGKCFRTSNLSDLYAEDNLLYLVRRIRIEIHFPLKDPLLISCKSMLTHF